MSVEKKVPEIRFKEFSGNWRETNIAHVCSNFRSGKFIKAEDIKKYGAYPVYGGNGLRGYTSEYNHEGSFALIGRQGALCGNMNFSHGKAFFTEHAIAVQANEKNDTIFLYYKLGLMNLGQYSGQSAQPGLSVNRLTELETYTPVKQEQTLIGNTFQKLDSLINQHQQKHDKLSNIKKAMLEKMFPKQGETIPEIRFKGFSGEWEEKGLGEVIEIIGTGKSVFVVNAERTELNRFSILGSRGVIGYDCSYDYSGDFILTARVGENAGRLYKYSGNVKITDNTVFIKSDNLHFVFYLLTNFDLRRLAFGTGQPLIKASELNGLKLCFPYDRGEQTAIGNYFQKLDALINQHQQQITKLNNIKQACLSKMFI